MAVPISTCRVAARDRLPGIASVRTIATAGLLAAAMLMGVAHPARADVILTQAEAGNAHYPTTDGAFSIAYNANGDYGASLVGYVIIGTRSDEFDITATHGGAFTFNGLDIFADFGGPASITITGLVANVSVGSDTFTTSSGTLVGKTPVNLAHVSMTELQISGSDSNGFAGFANLDLTEPATAAPEPTSLVLLGAGLIGLGASRRRKRV